MEKEKRPNGKKKTYLIKMGGVGVFRLIFAMKQVFGLISIRAIKTISEPI